MTYVPGAVPPAPSPRARELGRRLTETIDDFRREHPGTSKADIGQAVSLATRAGTRGRATVFALVLGLAILGALVAFYLSIV